MQPIDALSRDERTALRAMVSALIALGITVPSGAQAEGWTGADKTQHMAVSAALGGIAGRGHWCVCGQLRSHCQITHLQDGVLK